ncbi:hypothetical protein [Paraburkholderia acidiphila]|uniref:HTH cro/C1-type domain-containing protein n=1 Tax=Paraburkholderia acidiphila TaxID=2571747 RepID=A0A7Z2G8R9_9BURK|nr:hypothetical protein [Paraburkholderia acidiphila]QGZ56854.1 hypothetical protein FAZ97_18010 [Paraburkholderia acidiphila]
MSNAAFREAQLLLARRLRELRTARGLSLTDFARQGWATSKSVKNVESAETDARLEFIARASGTLKVHPASLFVDCEFPFISFTKEELVNHVFGRVEVYRRMQHIFHSELARRAGLGSEYVHLMEMGLAGGKLSGVAKLSAALHVNIWLLFA